MGVDVKNLRRVVAATAGVTAAVQAATAVAALRNGRRDYVDAVWGPGLGAIAVTAAVVGRGDRARRWGLAAVTSVWAARLGSQIAVRLRHSDKEDPRYTEYLEGDSTAAVVGKVFLTQGLAQLVVSAPIQLAAASALPRTARRRLLPLGLAVMVAGTVIEATADRQKDRYRARTDAAKPPILDSGLWAWSRHPNYFGDSLVWDGAWLASVASAPGGWTVPAPALMSYLLIVATGARQTERRMQERPGYRDYQRRVSFFVPLPPKKRDEQRSGR